MAYNRPMRIVMVAPFGLGPKGTTRWRVLPFARAVARLGQQVRVVVPSWDWGPDAGRCWEDAGVRVVCPRVCRWSALSASLAARVLTEMEREKPDVVHAFKPIGYSGLAALWARARGIPTCVDSDDWEGRGGWSDTPGRPWWQRWLIRRQELLVLVKAQRVTVASRALADIVVQGGVPADRVAYLPNPSSIRSVSAERCEESAVAYSRFAECPPWLLAEIWQRVHALVPRAVVTVIGAGFRGEERELARIVEERGLAHTVRVVGRLPPDAVGRTLARAHVGLFPCEDTLINRTKCPVRLADMVAAGLPVVAHRVGECAEYVRAGESGVLVEPGDTDGFARAVAVLLAHPQRAMALGRRAGEWYMERFAVERGAATLVSVYREAFADTHGRSTPGARNA